MEIPQAPWTIYAMLHHCYGKRGIFFLILKWKPPAFPFVPTASHLFTGHHWEGPGLISLLLPISNFYTEKTPPSLLSRLSSPSCQSLLLWQMLQDFVPVRPCLPCTRETRTGHSTPGVVPLTNTEWKTRVPSSQVAGNTLPNAQDFVSFLCPRFTLLLHVHQNHQILSCQAAFQLVITQSVPHVLPPGAGLCHFPSLNLIKFPISYFSRKWLRSPWMAAQPSGLSITLLSFVSSANLLGVHSVPSFGSLRKRLNSVCSRMNPWSTHNTSAWPPTGSHAADHSPLNLSVQLPFGSFTLSVYLVCTSPAYLWGCYKRQYWKPHWSQVKLIFRHLSKQGGDNFRSWQCQLTHSTFF